MELTLSLIAVVLSVISTIFAAYTFIWTTIRDRKQATLEAYNLLQEQVFDQINLYQRNEILEIIKDNHSPEYKVLSGYVARIEHFCVGVNEKIYDFNTVYELGHGYFDAEQIKSRVEPIVNRKLENTTYDYYSNIHKVWARMDKRGGSKHNVKNRIYEVN